jgi:sensor histidine kinase regulating citrate/malate metabolism
MKKHLFYTLSLIILTGLFLLGFAATNFMAEKIEMDERANLLVRAKTVAAIIDKDAIRALNGTSTDQTKPEYAVIKRTLESVHKVNTDTRFVYIFGLRNEEMYFIADAEPSSSKDFSAPGDPYEDALASDITNYKEAAPYTKGPYTDAWGDWFSAYAPIIDNNGSTIGMLGLDIQSEKLLLRISIVKQATVIVFSLLFLSVLVVLALIRDSFIIKK